MIMHRHVFASLALAATRPVSHAQRSPARPIRPVVPISAGGATDLRARTTAQGLGHARSQPLLAVDAGPAELSSMATADSARAAWILDRRITAE